MKYCIPVKKKTFLASIPRGKLVDNVQGELTIE